MWTELANWTLAAVGGFEGLVDRIAAYVEPPRGLANVTAGFRINLQQPGALQTTQ